MGQSIIFKMCIFCHHSPDSPTSCTGVTEFTDFLFSLVKKEKHCGQVSVTDKVEEIFSDICCQDHQTRDLVWVLVEYSLIAKKGLMGPTTFDMYCLWHISLLPKSQWHEQPWLWMVDFQLILHFTFNMLFFKSCYLFLSTYFKIHYWIYIYSSPN